MGTLVGRGRVVATETGTVAEAGRPPATAVWQAGGRTATSRFATHVGRLALLVAHECVIRRRDPALAPVSDRSVPCPLEGLLRIVGHERLDAVDVDA